MILAIPSNASEKSKLVMLLRSLSLLQFLLAQFSLALETLTQWFLKVKQERKDKLLFSAKVIEKVAMEVYGARGSWRPWIPRLEGGTAVPVSA